jgi:hypothetical protein
MNNKYGLLAVLLFVFLGSLGAKTRTIRFFYFRAPADAPQSAYMYMNQEALGEVEIPRNNFSKAMQLQEGPLKLYFLPEAMVPAQEFPFGAPSVEIPEEWDEVLIFVSSDMNNAILPMKFYAINGSDSDFQAGDRMFINMTDNAIFGLVGSETLKLKPKSIETVRNPAKSEGSYRVKLDRFDPNTNKTKTLIRQVWKQSTTQKSIILIYSPSGSGRVSYYSVPVRNY